MRRSVRSCIRCLPSHLVFPMENSKGLELAKLARTYRQQVDCATWLHKARDLPKEQFKQEVVTTPY